jgi:hypothetical protein
MKRVKKQGYLCKGCAKEDCPIGGDLPDFKDKPSDCKYFIPKSMCIFCKHTCKEKDRPFFICGNFRHKKGY